MIIEMKNGITMNENMLTTSRSVQVNSPTILFSDDVKYQILPKEEY